MRAMARLGLTALYLCLMMARWVLALRLWQALKGPQRVNVPLPASG
jgi:hypothetical protein